MVPHPFYLPPAVTHMTMRASRPFLATCALAAIPATVAADVTSYRNVDGLYPDATPPMNWEDPGALLWKIDPAVKANAAPILVAGKLFYTEEPAALVCADAMTGETLWKAANAYEDIVVLSPEEQKELVRAKAAMETMAQDLDPLKREQYRVQRQLRRDKENSDLKKKLRDVNQKIRAVESKAGTILKRFEKPKTHSTNGYASYTPCSDGKTVFVCNGLGVVARYDLDGKRLWAKRMEQPDHGWGGSVSPTLVGGRLIVRFSDYTALDPETGEELWRVPNPNNFGVPASFQLEGQWFLYTGRGELIRVADGKKLPSRDWTIAQMKFAFFNTPCVDGNRVYVVHGAQGIQGDAYCMEIPATVKELEKAGLRKVWYKELYKDRYYASPVVHDGLLYTFSMQHRFQVLDTATGDLVYDHKVEGITGRTFPGLLLVGDKIFAGEEDGTVIVVEPGREYREAARFRIGECRNTPVFDGNTVYLRTLEHLFAFRGE